MCWKTFVRAAWYVGIMGLGRAAGAADAPPPVGDVVGIIGPAVSCALSPGVGHPFPGDRRDTTDLVFGVIPTKPISSVNYYNSLTKMVEQRLSPAILHPIPVLRAKHICFYSDPPDLKTIGRDDLTRCGSEATLTATTKYGLAAGDNGFPAVLLTISDVQIPEDKTGDWRVSVKMEPVSLVVHVPDPIADRGRAVPTPDPLPLGGHLVYSLRPQFQDSATVMSLDLSPKASAKPVEIAKGVDCRVSPGGTILDRVDSRTLKVTDKSGRPVGKIAMESDIEEFNVSPDGSRLVVSTERMTKPKTENELPRREIASMVFTADGKFVSEIIGYDDAGFLPDGNLVLTATGGGPGLFLGEVSTGKVTPIKLLDGPSDEPEPAWVRTPTVSPDGKRIAYVSGRDAFVVGIDGRGWTPLWRNPKQEPQAQPVFSPDGKYVAVINVPLNVMNGPGEVIVIDLQKRVRQHLPLTRGANSQLPLTWQP